MPCCFRLPQNGRIAQSGSHQNTQLTQLPDPSGKRAGLPCCRRQWKIHERWVGGFGVWCILKLGCWWQPGCVTAWPLSELSLAVCQHALIVWRRGPWVSCHWQCVSMLWLCDGVALEWAVIGSVSACSGCVTAWPLSELSLAVCQHALVVWRRGPWVSCHWQCVSMLWLCDGVVLEWAVIGSVSACSGCVTAWPLSELSLAVCQHALVVWRRGPWVSCHWQCVSMLWLCDGVALEWAVIGSVSACSDCLVIPFLFPSKRPALFPNNVPAMFALLVQLSYNPTSPSSLSVYSCVRLLRMVFPDRILCIVNN